MKIKYYICEYCGNQKRSIRKRKRPKCDCPGGQGKTFMSLHDKKTYFNWKKNIELTKKSDKKRTKRTK